MSDGAAARDANRGDATTTLPDLIEAMVGTGLPRRAGALVVTAVGAGGKTSVLRALARAYADRGRRVVVTTTTKMALEPGLVTDVAEVRRQLADASPVLAGTPLPQLPGATAKFTALPGDGFDRLRELADVVLVEGDGSRGLPVKAPAPHEPVVPPATDMLVVVAGLSALGLPWGEACFRAELVPSLLARASMEATVDPPMLARLVDAGYLRHPGLTAWAGRRVIVLNQADDGRLLRLARQVAAALPGERVMMTVRGERVATGESGRY